MELWTVHIARHRAVRAAGIRFLDTTIQYGHAEFAPTWTLLKAYKAGTISEDQYAILYYHHMQHSLFENPKAWHEVLTSEKVAIGCVCAAGAFCHRHLLSHVLDRVCRERGLPFTHHGEFGVDNPL